MAPELNEILDAAKTHQSFVLNGGAGSGKTHSLIETIKGIYADTPKAKIACITYTNVAVNEIKERAPFEDLYVSTIHEFLWKTIARYQSEIRVSLSKLIENGDIKTSDTQKFTEQYFIELKKNIEYREWRDYSRGVISHDELVKIVCYMFSRHDLLQKILSDSYDYIFIDEYQDAFPEILNIPIKQVASIKRKCMIGMFGDPMQAIYDRSSPEEVKALVAAGTLKELQTSYNRRSPSEVLRLINKLRLDNIVQEAPDDEKAPNYEKLGSATFLYSNNDSLTLNDVRKSSDLPENFFNVASQDIKELFLVKRFIAEEAGFSELFDIYVTDQIINFCNYSLSSAVSKHGIVLGGDESLETVMEQTKIAPTEKVVEYSKLHGGLFSKALKHKFVDLKKSRLDAELFMSAKKMSDYDTRDRGQRCDDLIQHIIGLQEIIALYGSRKYNEFIRKTNYKIESIKHKKKLYENMEELVGMGSLSIGEVLGFADESGIWKRTERLNRFEEDKKYRYDRVMGVPYTEIINLFNYTENNTPYSTQHGIKGAEYKNVFVVLDNGGWNNYNFEYLFEQRTDKARVVQRSQKMFYVCCSRALDNLVVFYQNPTEKVLIKAKEWFGESNVKEI